MGQRTAIVCIARNEDRTVREWIDYHLKLGFDRIFMYQNDWTCDVENERVTKLRFDGRAVQVQAYNHWLGSEHRKDFDHAAFIDCDEFIVLHKHKTISDFLSEFDHPVGVSPNWVGFGSGGQESPHPNPESLIKRFTFRGEKPDKHVKTILNLRSDAVMLTPHSPNRPTTDTRRKPIHGPFSPDGPIDVIQLNHYYHKSKLEWSERVARGRISVNATRPIEEWDQNVANFRDVQDLAALNFLYGNEPTIDHFWQKVQGWGNMFDQGELLKQVLMVADKSQHLNICEIGVYCGRTTAIWNVELLNQGFDYTYLAVDHFMGSDKHDKSRDYLAETTKNLAPVIHKVQIIKNHSVSEAGRHPDNSFDLVYIDASHDYQSVLNDINAWLPKVKPGGFIGGDDYIAGWPGVVRAVDQTFALKANAIRKIGGQQWLHQKPKPSRTHKLL